MKSIASVLLVAIAPFLAISVSAAQAPRSPEQLEKWAANIVSGTVSEVTVTKGKSQVAKGFFNRDRFFKIRLEVTDVSKGDAVKTGETIMIAAWQAYIRPFWFAGLQGHSNIPEKGAKITVYLLDKEGEAYTPLHPNGIVLKGSKRHQEFLHRAAEAGDIDLLKRLIAEGLDVNANFGMGTPLKYAAWGGHEDAVQFLLKQGAKVDAAEDGGRTPLRYAAWGSRKHNQASLAVAKELIKNGADVNHGADNGFTPLHEAAMRGSKEITELLIENGAEVNIRISSGSYKGKTPLDLAQNTDVIAILRKHGGKSGDR